MIAELFVRTPETSAGPGGAAPIILLDSVPLADALKQLAHQAAIDIRIDPQISAGRAGADG